MKPYGNGFMYVPRADECSYTVSSDRFFEEDDGFYIEITRV